jgi:hypothetical protein
MEFTMAENKTMQQRIEVLALNQVDAAPYQRQTNGAQVQRIVNNFNEAKLGMPVVSARDGQYFIVDGTHRVAALRRLGFESAMFIVLQGLTYQQEADYFRRQNENTRGLTLYTRFKAGLESGDETGVADIRFRPEFAPGWYMDLDFTFNAALLSLEQLVSFVTLGGFAVGIGENRIEKGGQWGAYKVAEQ